jgi:hypothetical protein
MNALDAAKAAFGDLKALDRELEKYKNAKLNGVRVRGDVLSPGQIAVRPLTAGEAAIMDVHIRSQRGVNDKTAPGVAADARKIAAAYPNDPFVQTALAEAELDANNNSAAAAAADRALAAKPSYVRAMIYKGRAQIELTKGKSDANWSSVRRWFVNANRLDTENAEPLMRFYQTYEAAGVAPTKNAVDGLLYAVALAPQDDGLRVDAVHQMLTDGRLDQAKRLFAPLAYRPHATQKYRQSNAEIMAAITAGDGKRALSVLEAAMEDPEKKGGDR